MPKAASLAAIAAATVAAALTGILPVSARAQPTPPVYDRVDLSASAESEVDNDLLVATVYAEFEHSSQSRAADEVNTQIRWAGDRARAADGVRFQTQQYTTRPVYANDRRIVGWVARQSIRLESADAAALSALLGDLQTRVAIESLQSTLSPAAREQAEENLIAEALAAFGRRAELVARELGRSGYRIVQINVGTAGPIAYRRNLGILGVAEAQAAPDIAAGTQSVTVSVNGTIELDAAP